MISVSLPLDNVFRPVAIPDHFIAYKVSYNQSRTVATVEFLRLRDDHGEAKEFIEDARSRHYTSCYVNPASVHYIRRAAQSASEGYQLTYERVTDKDVWKLVTNAAFSTLLTAFDNPAADIQGL